MQKLLITNLGSFVRGGAIQILFPFLPLGKLHLSRHLFLLNCCNPCLLFPMNSGNAAQSSCPADMKVLSPDPNLILPVLSQGRQPCANNQGLSSSPPYPRLLSLQPSGQFNQPQTHHFANKVCLAKATVSPVVLYGCESWTIKKAECQRIDAFVALEKILESPLDCKKIKPVNSKGNQP